MQAHNPLRKNAADQLVEVQFQAICLTRFQEQEGVSVTWNNQRRRKQSGLWVQPGSEVTLSLLSSSWAPIRDRRVNEAGGPIMVGSGYSQWRGKGTPDTGIGKLIMESGKACHILVLQGVR